MDRRGLPLPIGSSAANLHDSQALIPLVRGIPPICSRRGRRRRRPGKLRGDKGYDYQHRRRRLSSRGIRHRIARKGIEPSPTTGAAPLGRGTNRVLAVGPSATAPPLRAQARALPHLHRQAPPICHRRLTNCNGLYIAECPPGTRVMPGEGAEEWGRKNYVTGSPRRICGCPLRSERQATAKNTELQQRVTELEDDFAAARTSLRRMIRDENRPLPAPWSSPAAARPEGVYFVDPPEPASSRREIMPTWPLGSALRRRERHLVVHRTRRQRMGATAGRPARTSTPARGCGFPDGGHRGPGPRRPRGDDRPTSGSMESSRRAVCTGGKMPWLRGRHDGGGEVALYSVINSSPRRDSRRGSLAQRPRSIQIHAG
jgi:hypothetical protein